MQSHWPQWCQGGEAELRQTWHCCVWESSKEMHSERTILWISCNSLNCSEFLLDWTWVLNLNPYFIQTVGERWSKWLWSQSQYVNHLPQNHQQKWLYKKLFSEKGGKGLEWQTSFTCWLGLELSSFFSDDVKKGLATLHGPSENYLKFYGKPFKNHSCLIEMDTTNLCGFDKGNEWSDAFSCLDLKS